MPTTNEIIDFTQTEEEPKTQQKSATKPLDEISPFSPRLTDDYAEALTLIGNDPNWEGFDWLKNRYPAFSPQIDEMRRRGLSDFDIANGFRNRVEPFVNFSSGKGNRVFGRTEENLKLDAAFQRSQNFQLYQQMFPKATPQDIDDAIFLSAWSEGGISAPTLLAHPELMKGLAKGQKISEGFIESIKNGWMSDQIEGEISKREADIMNFKTEITPELEKELDKLDEEAAKYSEQPLNGSIINRAFKGAAQQSHLILEGMRQGVPYGLTAGAMTAAAGNAGPQALMPEELITVPTAFSMGMSWGTLRHIQEREATAVFRELRRITDSNGNKIDLNTARIAAHLVGGINTVIEFFQLRTLAKFFPGGERFLTGITSNATKNLVANPVFQKILEGLKNIVKEFGQEELQEAVPVIVEEGTKYFYNELKGTNFAYATPEEIFNRLKEIGIDTILSTTVLAGLGAVTHGASKTTQYLRERKYKNLLNDTANALKISPEELESAIREAVQEAEQDPSVASSQERQDPSVGQADISPSQGRQESFTSEEQKTDFVFVPEESLENFNAENPADAVEPVFNSNGEAALTPEQFEQVKNADKNFVLENNNDIRYGSDGVTLTETANKISMADPETSIRFHSKEIQNEVNEVRQQLINTGNDEQEASDAANILGIALSNIYESEGEKAEVTVQQAPEAKPIEYTRIQDENYELSQPETFPNQERAEELNRSLTLETVADDADLAKALKETLTGENKNALDEIPTENVVQPNLTDENAKGIRKKATGILREELKDLQAEYDNSVIETFKGIRAKEFDPKKIVIDSKTYQWFNRKNKSTYQFKGKDSRTTNIVIALDGDDAVVKVNPPQKGQQMIFTIKDFRNADLAEILGDLFSGNISDGLAIKDSPTAKNVMFALNEFWEENGILEAQDIAEENVRKYNENLEAETKEWEKTVDAVNSGELESTKRVQVMKSTPHSMQLAGAKDLPIYMNIEKFAKIAKKHTNITNDIIKQVPKAISEPIAIFESETVPGDIVVMTDIQDKQGATVIIPVELDAKHEHYYINRIKSVYAKNDKATGEPNNIWFINQAEAGRTLYVNMQKISEWNNHHRLYLPYGSSIGDSLSSQRRNLDGLHLPLEARPVENERTIANENDLVKAIRNTPEVNLNDEVRNYTDIEGNVTAFTTWKDLKAFINIIKSGNFAANVHEIGHVVFRVLERLSKSGSIQADKDFQTVLDHAGVTREQFYSEAENKTGGFRETVHEWFAKALEVYMSEGKAPTSKLQALFTRVKNYMLKIYHDIQTQLGIKIDDDVRAVFDRLFAMTDDASTVAEAVDFNSRVSSQINSYNTDIRQAQSELALMDQQSKGLVSVFPQFARTADGDEIGFVYRVMDVRDVITSHEDNGTENKNFPQELQPRHSRDSVASQQQIQKIANNLDPELLADNRQVSEGAPIIGEDDLVESGNARSIAIRKAYNEGNAENYKNYLVENAEKFGLNPDAVKKIERPVLVRVHLANMDENMTREQFVLKANEFSTLDNQAELKENKKIKKYKALADKNNKALKDENKRIQAEYKTELENVNKSHEGEIRQLEREHNAEIKSIEVKAQKEIKALEKEVEKLTKKQGENSQEIENLKLKNQEKIEKINEKYEKQKGELKEKHKQKISDLRLQRDEKINKLKEQFKEKTDKNKQKFDERLAKKVEKLTGRAAKKLGKTVVNLKKQIKQKQERINNLTSVIKELNSKNNINKMVKGITAMSKGKNVYQIELDEIHELLEKYDLKRKGKENRQKQELIYSYLNNEGEKYTSDILEEENITQEDIQAFTEKTHLEFMTLAEVKELYNKVKEIYQRGRESYKQWEDARNQRISAMQNSMAQDIISKTKVPENTVPTQPEDVLAMNPTQGIRWVYNATKMTGRFLHGLGENFRKFAGDNISKAHGVASENIYRREAELAEKIRRKSKGLNPARDFSKHAITLDGKSYNWNEVMAVYLYSLNEKGYQALLWGNFVQNAANKDKLYKTQQEGETAIAKLIQFLHENEIYKNAADLMKDDFEENYQRIRQSQIDATAKGMGKEENYFPLFRMARKTSKGIMEIMIDNIIDNGDKQNQLIPNVDDGFTISRAEISENSQQPIILDAYGNWQRGVRQQENYAAFRGVISELTSALICNGDNGSVQQLIKKRLGISYWRDLVNILKHSVKDSAMAEQDAGNALINWIKKNRTVSALAYNVPVALGQTASYFAGVAKMFHETGIHGAGHVLRSVINALRGGKSFMENVYKLMPELRFAGGDVESRAYREQRLINRYSEKHPFIGDFRNLYHKFISFGLSWNGFFDRVTKAIVFDGAYNSYLENGYDVEEAVRLARRVVQDTQPSSFSREMTALNRSQAVSLFMQFTNALAPIYNMTVVDTVDALREQGTWNAVKQAALYVSATALGALWIGFIRDLFWRRLPTGEELPNGEEDNYVRWAAYTAIDGMANTIPLYSAAYKDWRMSANYRYSFNTDPFSGPFRKIARGSKLFFGEDYEGRRTEGVLNMLDGLSNLGVIPSFPTTSARMLYRWFAPRE